MTQAQTQEALQEALQEVRRQAYASLQLQEKFGAPVLPNTVAPAVVITLLDHIAMLEVGLNGANERVQIMLTHKNRWCDRAINLEAELAQLRQAGAPEWIEALAQNWDGCMYDAPGEMIDIGASIREAASRATSPTPPAQASKPVPLLPENLVAKECWCTTCRPITAFDMRFVACPDCGNKRCPKARNHINACTNSNASGQPGSSWEHVKPFEGACNAD